MRVIIQRNKTPRKESSHEHQMRVLHEQKIMEKQKAMIDAHDTLHSIFWGTPTRAELRPVWERLGRELVSLQTNQMQAEFNEALAMGLVRA